MKLIATFYHIQINIIIFILILKYILFQHIENHIFRKSYK